MQNENVVTMAPGAVRRLLANVSYNLIAIECIALKGTYSNKIAIIILHMLDVDCGPLPVLENGEVHLSEARTSFGVVATYTCHDNYTLSGVQNRTCGLSGWLGKQPECLVDWCPDPPSISGGTVTVNERRAGSIAKYECEVGYVLLGEPVRLLHFYYSNHCSIHRLLQIFSYNLTDYYLRCGR